MSLQDRVSKVLISSEAYSRIIKGNIKLFSKLSKTKLVEELLQRSIKFTCQSTTKELQGLLECEMHSIQRLPAVLFNNHVLTIKDINLENYEILKNEPLHNVSNQIKNLYEEMLNHVPKDMRSSFKKIISASYNGKEAKKGADHRESLVYIYKWLMNMLPDHFSTTIFSSMLEIQEILYSPDKNRNCILILHLYLRTFVFSMMIKIHLQGKLKTMTERKFFGTYYHSLTRRAAEQYRLFSGRSPNTEKEEATFNKIKVYTDLTSNHHPENLTLNAVILLQVNEEFSQKLISKENNLSHVYHPIKESFSNTIIPFDWIEKYDYLLNEKKWWEENTNGVVFYDIDNNDHEKIINHFRSSTLKEENKYLDKSCEQCSQDMHNKIPTFKIKVHNGDTSEIIFLKTL